MTEAQLLITGATGGTGRSATQALIKQGACTMKRRLGPIFNAANDPVEQALSKTSPAELVRGVG
jgi:NAD(P)-dependent dehydrogenase (short-subunit alcohol dehydrogenase family)